MTPDPTPTPSRPPGRPELAVVRVALAVVALHALDGAFVHPQPGTSADDHLASGLVPAGLLALLAIAYPRLHPWWQSLLAASAGVLALVGGIGASARHVLIDRLSGADATGVLAALAGAALLGCAVAAGIRAWRPRAADTSRGRRLARRLGLSTAVLAIVLFLLVPVGTAILATSTARAPVTGAVDLGRPGARVSLRTRDGLVLRGWYVPSRNRAAVLAFPGRTDPLEQARMLVRHGYGVLLLDPRGTGESQGDHNAFGWGGARDVEAAAAYLSGRPDVDRTRIGGIGLSVGGELLLQAAARTPLLRAVVSEGAGVRSIRDHVAVDGGPLRWISPLLAQTIATAVLSDRMPPPPLTDLIGRIAPRAVFLIWAGRGQGGEEQNADYYAAAGSPRLRWEIPEAGHTGGLDARPAEYERRVVAFFDRHLLGR